jgi:hypothetical protein
VLPDPHSVVSSSRFAESGAPCHLRALRVTGFTFPVSREREPLGECTPPWQGAPREPRGDERADRERLPARQVLP